MTLRPSHVPSGFAPLALPLHSAWRQAVVQGGAHCTVGSSPAVKYLGQVICKRRASPPATRIAMPFSGTVPFGGLRFGQVSGMLPSDGFPHRPQQSHAAPVACRPPGSASALRQLRVAAGLTQSELAGDRFSKEYISQIERGKTRPTQETVDWLALRLGVDAGYLASGVSADERARAEALLARADALMQERALRRRDRRSTAARYAGRARDRLGGAARPCCSPAKAIALAHHGEPRAALELLNQARALAEGEPFSDLDRADVLFRLGVCRYLHVEHLDGRRPLRRGARARRAVRPSVRRAARRTSSAGAPAATAASATTRLRARTSSARSSSPRRCTTRARSARRTSRRRCSPSATVTGCSPARTPSRRRRSTRCSPSSANVGRLHNNLGGLEFLLGKPDAGDRAPQAGVRRRARGRPRRRRRDGGLLARAGAPAHRRPGDGRGAGAARAAAHRRPRGHARRDRQRAARARPRAARAGPARRGRATALADADDAFAKHLVRFPPGCGLGRPGRPGDSARRRARGRRRCTAAPPRHCRTSGSRRR